MIRTTLLWMLVAFLAAYAWRDWYKSLCGLILLMAVVQHPDFPNSVFGIHGMNPWNVLLAVVVFAWLAARKTERLEWDAPKSMIWLLIIFFTLIVLSYVKLAGDRSALGAYANLFGEEPPSQMYLFSEYIINCMKWIVPGLLLFDGCRSESRLKWAMFCILTMYVLLAVQVIRWMPLSMLTSGDELNQRGLKILANEVGYHRVNISMILAGASWAMYAVRQFPKLQIVRLLTVFLSGVLLFSTALTGGRMGLVTWVIMGLIFSIWKWRRLLLLGPVLLIIVIAVVPPARDRLMQGFGSTEIDTNVAIEETMQAEEGETHWYTVTSGRSFAWPFVLEKIGESPVLGYGRDAMIRTGVAGMLWTEYGESFPHPHNAYLEWIMDNGFLGAIPVFLMFIIIVRQAGSLFNDDDDVLFVAVGGFCLSLVLAFLIAGIGSQTFYPREGAVGMWCAIGLMLRVSLLRRSRVRETAAIDNDGGATVSQLAADVVPLDSNARRIAKRRFS